MTRRTAPATDAELARAEGMSFESAEEMLERIQQGAHGSNGAETPSKKRAARGRPECPGPEGNGVIAVLAHEVVHLVHDDHGHESWRLLGRIMPDYEARRAKLRGVGARFEW